MSSLAKRPRSALTLVASLALAATTGALVAFGRRQGGAALPFAATGAVMSRQTVSATATDLVLLGVLVHAIATVAWSALFLWLARERRMRPVIAAIVVAACAHVASWVVAWSSGNGIASVLPLGDRVVLAIVLAGALVVGIRLAFSGPREG